MTNRILIIAAHPDDEMLGCGATVAKMVKNNSIARTVILGQGMLSRKSSKGSLNELRKNAQEANRIIGINEVHFHDFPDNSMDTVPLLKIIKTVEKEIDSFQPSIIFTHYGNDLNIDHRITFQAVMTSCRPQPNFKTPTIYSFYTVSSTDWIDGNIFQQFSPNVFLDISDTIDLKLTALSKYKSEMMPSPHSRSLESVRIFSRYWGMRVGKQYVEPFSLVRKVGL